MLMTPGAAAMNRIEHRRWVTIQSLEGMSPMPVSASSYAWHPADFLFRHAAERAIPVYIVLDLSVPWVRIAKPFPKGFGLRVEVHCNDHKPPHIHIECPPGTPRTRYQWPELRPLRGDRSLRAAEEKRLRKYLAVHGPAIGHKITSIPWK